MVVLEQQNNVGTVPMTEKNCCCRSCNSCCSFFLSQPSLTFQKRCEQKKFIKLVLFTFLPFKWTTSKTWTRTLDPGPGPWTLDPDPGPWTRTLDPDPGPWTPNPDLDPEPGP